jgi:hypothetical protein
MSRDERSEDLLENEQITLVFPSENQNTHPSPLHASSSSMVSLDQKLISPSRREHESIGFLWYIF